MKTTIVYNHPYEGSFNHVILERAVETAEKAGQEVQVIDLDKEKFNPVMSSQDLLGFVKHEQVDPQAKHYGELLAKSQHLVLIFPIWWELMPAMMKGFIDKVVFPGSFYDYKPNGLQMQRKIEGLETITIITTMNTPKSLYRFLYGNAIQKALVRGTFKKAGYKDVKWLSLNQVKQSSQEQRAGMLYRVANLLTKRFN